jgi:hypothetical protein
MTNAEDTLYPFGTMRPFGQVGIVQDEVGSEDLVDDVEPALILDLLNVTMNQGFVLCGHVVQRPFPVSPAFPSNPLLSRMPPTETGCIFQHFPAQVSSK